MLQNLQGTMKLQLKYVTENRCYRKVGRMAAGMRPIE